MKFKFHNSVLPLINSIILIRQDTGNMIGIVEAISNDNIVVLLLDSINRKVIHKNDDWILLNINDMQALRNSYKTFKNENIDGILNEAFLNFKNAFGIA